jgi:hypothetical protein
VIHVNISLKGGEHMVQGWSGNLGLPNTTSLPENLTIPGSTLSDTIRLPSYFGFPQADASEGSTGSADEDE